MHAVQRRLLELASLHELGKMSLREIGQLIEKAHPQTIKHHLLQLEHKGLVEVDRGRRVIRRVRPETASSELFIAIPILGSADCGPPTFSNQEGIQGYIKISRRLVRGKSELFALKAVGDSMNNARIGGANIEDGDYVIVDSSKRQPRNKEYVVSVIEGLANIKRFLKDNKNGQIVLISESTKEFPPIVIHPEDIEFLICGTVERVIKKPSLS
jgi:repressor LexA